VIGVGVNLRPAAYPPEVEARATNLESELGGPVPGAVVLADILEALADRVRALEADRPGDILQAWRVVSPSANGTAVTWSDGAIQKAGFTAGIDDEGALLVRTPAGIERLIGGELHWELGDS
jgi:BirA family biotin operon repressor/biotin-[acetyl-CoA-carboxylase] ligase